MARLGLATQNDELKSAERHTEVQAGVSILSGVNTPSDTEVTLYRESFYSLLKSVSRQHQAKLRNTEINLSLSLLSLTRPSVFPSNWYEHLGAESFSHYHL